MKELKICLDDDAILELMKTFKTDNENEAVMMAIHEAIKKQSNIRILALNGNISWEGNLDEMRENRT